MSQFFAWLVANGFIQTRGDVHWNNAGWWYPKPPADLSAENATLGGWWIWVEQDRENNAAFIAWQGKNGRDGAYVEEPSRAREIVSAALTRYMMEWDEREEGGGGFSRFGGVDEDRAAVLQQSLNVEREDPWAGRDNTVRIPVTAGGWICNNCSTPNTKGTKDCRACGRAKGAPMLPLSPRKYGPSGRTTSWEKADKEIRDEARARLFKGLGGHDEGVSNSCDSGAHERCASCDCGCHVKTYVKVCSCGRSFTRSDWDELPSRGVQVIEADDEGPESRLSLKNCRCGTTLALES